MEMVEVGQVVEVTSEMLVGQVKGIIEKMYDNSCIINVTEFDDRDDDKLHELINRVVVRYRDITPIPVEAVSVA